MTLSAYLGVAGLSDAGYQFFNANETSNGSRVTAGIVDAGAGWYSVANVSVPGGAASVRWNSPANPELLAREYFAPVTVDSTQIADEILKRDWTLVSGEADSSLLQALRSIRNKWEINASGLLTVFKEDGATVAWQRNVLSMVDAVPIVGME